MEEIYSDFSDNDFDGFIDEMKKDDDCFFYEETSNATTTFSSSDTTTSPTPPTNSADISVPTNSIPQYQEKPGPTTQLSGAEPV